MTIKPMLAFLSPLESGKTLICSLKSNPWRDDWFAGLYDQNDRTSRRSVIGFHSVQVFTFGDQLQSTSSCSVMEYVRRFHFVLTTLKEQKKKKFFGAFLTRSNGHTVCSPLINESKHKTLTNPTS